MTVATQQGNFRRLARESLQYAPNMVVEKWRSEKTGLTVLWANFDSPLLNAYITVATEIFNDSGVPHTLEHLVFLGSDKYPYKGVLDSLANRAFAQGTNAWTANDHTAYTLTTAGSDGFLRMLPVYCDHVFYPTLTKDGFVTEVYHVNGKFEDAGVVYSEMQGRENSSADLMELKTQRMLYPPSNAYRSETGGLMSALRVLTIDDIRAYHGKYYAPYNTALVLCGPLDRDQLFSTLGEIESRLIEKQSALGEKGPSGWKRPFMETLSNVPPVIDGSKLQQPGVDDADAPADGSELCADRRYVVIDFPERDESVGDVQVSYVGPTLDEHDKLQALDVLGTYLSDSTVSPLQQAFVELDQPLCTDIYITNNERAGASVISVSFSSVPYKELNSLDTQFVKVLQKVAQSIDMERMKTVLHRERLRLLSQLEMRPADCFSDVLIHEFLYGSRDGKTLAVALDDMRRFDKLDQYSANDWSQLLLATFVQNARLVVVGRPSAKLVHQLRAETQARVALRREKLGEKGANDLEKNLQDARKANDAPIPDSMLDTFAIPASDTIQWIPVATARTGPEVPGVPLKLDNPTEKDSQVQAHIDQDGVSPPFFIQYDHVDSQFVLITLVFGTEMVPQALRPLLSLYISTLFSLPLVRQDGSNEKLSYEAVVQALDEDVLEYDAAIGLGSNFSETTAIEFKVEIQHYEKAVAWLRDLLWGTEFSIDRLRIAAAKISQSLPEQKREGRLVAWSLSKSLLFSESDSTGLANSVMLQAKVVPEIVHILQHNPSRIVEKFEVIRKSLFQPDVLRVSIAGNILALQKPRTPWVEMFARKQWLANRPRPLAMPWARDTINQLAAKPHKRASVCALSSIESSYAVFTAQGISEYTHADYAALVVTITVLNAMESFLWRYIRGAGLAYGASIRNDPEARHIHFILYRSPNSAKAFVEARKVIQALASEHGRMDDGTVLRLDETTLESAKSSLHYSVADAEGTVGAAALECFLDAVIKCVGKGRGHQLLKEANAVTLQDVQQCLVKYILPLFDSSTSVAAVACSPSTEEPITEELRNLGYTVQSVEMAGASAEDSDASGSDEESSSISDGHSSDSDDRTT
ncbi:hypothetical protein MPSI1_003015 [Malassezia psittaci]|uniref:Uncharacterized protein n=1 Tax=Malassezia psittaci TaxID=1821823 RepID=A0AAF0FGY5_9BASI|nr:hypothetical protein MPSI1_003015 [Malassezia psittaci]